MRAQRFSFAAPDAMSVQLVGDFTHWQQNPINMLKDPDGVWRISVELKPGRITTGFWWTASGATIPSAPCTSPILTAARTQSGR